MGYMLICHKTIILTDFTEITFCVFRLESFNYPPRAMSSTFNFRVWTLH